MMVPRMPPSPATASCRTTEDIRTANRVLGAHVLGLYPLLDVHDLAIFASAAVKSSNTSFNWDVISEIVPEGILRHSKMFCEQQIPASVCEALRFLYRFEGISPREDVRRTAAALLSTSNTRSGTARARIARGVSEMNVSPEVSERIASALARGCSSQSYVRTGLFTEEDISYRPCEGNLALYMQEIPALIRLVRDELQEPDLLYIAVRHFVRPQLLREAVSEIHEALTTFSDENGPFVPLIESLFEGTQLELARYWMTPQRQMSYVGRGLTP